MFSVELRSEDMKVMGLAEGDCVDVRGRFLAHSTARIASPCTLERGCAGLNPGMQSRIGVSEGDEVQVSRAACAEAEYVKVAPEDRPKEPGILLPLGLPRKKEDGFSRICLIGAVTRKNDVLTVAPLDVGSLKDMPLDPVSAPEVFRALQSSHISCRVVETRPEGLVRISARTKILQVNPKDLESAKTGVSLSDVGGLSEVKAELLSSVSLSLRDSAKLAAYGVRAAKGAILYGPPGCGKTMLVKAVAGEVGAYFIYVRGPEVYNPYFGRSERMLRAIFQKARSYGNAVIFFDEIDSIAQTRNTAGDNSRLYDTILSMLLAEMDGADDNSGIYVVAATNRLDTIDPALLRPGRFDQVIKVPVPDEAMRKEILSIYLAGKPAVGEIDVGLLAQKTDGYTGADLENLVRTAMTRAVRESADAPALSTAHLLRALSVCKPSLTEAQIRAYEGGKTKDPGKDPMVG